MRQRDAEGRVTGVTGQTYPKPVRTKRANLHPSADMLPDAVSEIKRLRGLLLAQICQIGKTAPWKPTVRLRA